MFYKKIFSNKFDLFWTTLFLYYDTELITAVKGFTVQGSGIKGIFVIVLREIEEKDRKGIFVHFSDLLDNLIEIDQLRWRKRTRTLR